jgi:hypothetical protein
MEGDMKVGAYGTGGSTARAHTRGAMVALVTLIFLATAVLMPAGARAATPRALILADTVASYSATDGSPRSLEQQQAEADGFAVTLVDGATWDAMTASDFAQFQVLIIGDPDCEGDNAYAPAQANASVWEPVVMSSKGNKVLIGTDPTDHNTGPSGPERGDLLEARGIAFAGAVAGATGAYVDTSCEFSDSDDEGVSAPAGTPVPLLDGLSVKGPGQFTAGGAPCEGNISIVASSGPTAGLRDADLSDWGCSVHAFFDHWPSDWTPLAIATDPGVPHVYTATDVETNTTVSGSPYILVSGSGLSLTTFSCSPQSLRPGQPTICNYTLTGTTHPSGTVSFASNSSGAFSSPTCSLVLIGGNQSRCSVSYTPTAVGSGAHKIYANYSGDLTNAPSNTSTVVSVAIGAAGTSTVGCSPAPVGVGEATTCTITVTGASHPTGTVSFASNSSGAFDSATCTLAQIGGNQARCSVTYTPTLVGSGSHKIYASYSGDASDPPSHDSTTIAVNPGPSGTSVTCRPGSAAVGTPTTCTATVTGSIHPTGAVAFASNSYGTFSSSTCTLVALGGNQASCSVTYTPTIRGTGAHKIYVTYSGDAGNPQTRGSTTVSVP